MTQEEKNSIQESQMALDELLGGIKSKLSNLFGKKPQQSSHFSPNYTPNYNTGKTGTISIEQNQSGYVFNGNPVGYLDLKVSFPTLQTINFGDNRFGFEWLSKGKFDADKIYKKDKLLNSYVYFEGVWKGGDFGKNGVMLKGSSIEGGNFYGTYASENSGFKIHPSHYMNTAKWYSVDGIFGMKYLTASHANLKDLHLVRVPVNSSIIVTSNKSIKNKKTGKFTNKTRITIRKTIDRNSSTIIVSDDISGKEYKINWETLRNSYNDKMIASVGSEPMSLFGIYNFDFGIKRIDVENQSTSQNNNPTPQKKGRSTMPTTSVKESKISITDYVKKHLLE